MDFRSPWPLVLSLGRHVLAFVIFWIIGLALVQLGERMLGGWPASEVGQLVASVLGVAIALRLRAPVMAYLLAAMTAFSASEVVIHLYYGIRAAQGAPTHFAVMGAGIVGVVLGALLMMRGRRAPGFGAAALDADPPQGADTPGVDGTDATSDRRIMALQPAGARS